jgi:hypothetical protein
MPASISGPRYSPIFGQKATTASFPSAAKSFTQNPVDTLSLRFGNAPAAKEKEPSIAERVNNLLTESFAEICNWVNQPGLFRHENPLLNAIREGDWETYAKELGDRHPDSIDAGYGRKLSMLAGLNYENDILQDLFDKGADPEATDNRKQSLLALLMTAGNYEGLLVTLDTMKARGVDLDKTLNTPDEDGYTPLAWAVEQGDIRAAKVFLEHGAKPDIPEAADVSPAQLADHLENGGMLQLFKKYQ